MMPTRDSNWIACVQTRNFAERINVSTQNVSVKLFEVRGGGNSTRSNTPYTVETKENKRMHLSTIHHIIYFDPHAQEYVRSSRENKTYDSSNEDIQKAQMSYSIKLRGQMYGLLLAGRRIRLKPSPSQLLLCRGKCYQHAESLSSVSRKSQVKNVRHGWSYGLCKIH